MINQVFDLKATKTLLDNSSSYYIICTDTDGNYSYVNKHYARKFKATRENMVGEPFHVTMHPDDIKICEEVGAKCFEHPGKLFPATIRKHDGKGGYVVTQWEFTLMIEEGEIVGVFCLGYDITEFVRAKSEIETVTKDIEVKNELLDEIAFQQSHIVRAPLANIMGLVSLLKNLELGPNASSLITMLEESSNQLDDVVRGIVRKTV